jgi:hypothetical protein
MLDTVMSFFTGGGSTIIGGFLGGILRIIPEIFKWRDRKDERKHELAMQDKALEFQKLKGNQVVDEIEAKGQAEYDLAGIEALTEAIKGQDKPSGIKWIDGLSHLMRPAITVQWVIVLYPVVIACGLYTMMQDTEGGMTILEFAKGLQSVFGPDEKAIVSGIINFWFLDRVLRGVKK